MVLRLNRKPSAEYDGQYRHSRRHSKPDRQDARAKTGGHEQLATVFNHVARSKALSESGRHNRPSYKWQSDLAAMCVTSERQRHAIGNERKHVGVVRHQNHRSAIVVDSGKRGGDIVPTGPQIADARDPERAGPSAEPLSRLLEYANAILLERIPHAIVVQPSVVIAQDCHGAHSGTKTTQLDGCVLRRDELPSDDTLNDEVTENADHVWPRGIGPVHYLAKLLDAVERRAHMQIGEHGNAKRSVGGGSEIDALFCHRQAGRLEPKRLQGKTNDYTSRHCEAP
jgi:hypothetical protein